jgi:hypothetical protein
LSFSREFLKNVVVVVMVVVVVLLTSPPTLDFSSGVDRPINVRDNGAHEERRAAWRALGDKIPRAKLGGFRVAECSKMAE